MNIYVDSVDTQEYISRKYEVNVALYSVFDTIEETYNSPLWFEMFMPDEEVIHGGYLDKTQ